MVFCCCCCCCCFRCWHLPVCLCSCHFRRLDGNALFLSKYTRSVGVERCEFEWIGENAMATWGATEEYDATGGEQPRGTRIVGNIAHDVGLYEKQSSGWGQSKSCQSTVEGNGARA